MELRHLRYFVAVAAAQSVTKAAAHLGIQQPPLSQQIRDLERELGVELFQRTPRSVRLNDAGRVFLADAQAILAAADDAVVRVRRAAQGQLGRLVMGYTSSAALHPLVPRILRAFREGYPQVALDVREHATDGLFRAVRAEEMDAAFVRAPAERFAPLHAITLAEEAVVVALPRGHRLSAATDALALEELATEEFVLYRSPDGPGILDVLSAACHRAGFAPRAVATVPRLLSAAAMVAAGQGVAIMPMALQSLHRESVVYRTLDPASAFTIPLTLIWRDAPSGSPLAHFVALAKDD
ncbi:LysR family transcriptional regulator [Xanthomonas rydalmerensis]|uniref:LysR family transcriptional regulator n=1 Tax=Xanthomonas rydalmerensis TaxID=3046274 RepID=A0ABZ0JSU9_9XANT|nr:LysR family transcriptional regulator [Xanthomonas sp. DM-2023]WOS42755.1 LysR family transcriptional regulator [Xanthomonas sp. DM-2023]WOS46941.1 LysR family transcriptional regulator [Xanthomonas sp. DM-2023]WOS51120.1 LysR family transcriptional regulator [Xanthomonas sp. DM-2023]WOS55301.1 LysR family transcriptional regulator [Xanthomonas sp. DM-2023]WOS59483.1 LysR family transcriptional regulator [Xanthomonas sp. DM-2023]